MKIVLKSLIVWLMLLAIPLQGFAAATMLICAPLQPVPQEHRLVPAATMHHQQHALSSAVVTPPAHDHCASTLAKTAQADSAGHAGTHHADGKCNACGTCCFGASMTPSYAVRMPAEVQYFTTNSFESAPMASVDLALPERPPQTSLT